MKLDEGGCGGRFYILYAYSLKYDNSLSESSTITITERMFVEMKHDRMDLLMLPVQIDMQSTSSFYRVCDCSHHFSCSERDLVLHGNIHCFWFGSMIGIIVVHRVVVNTVLHSPALLTQHQFRRIGHESIQNSRAFQHCWMIAINTEVYLCDRKTIRFTMKCI